MKAVELRTKNDDDLVKALSERRSELLDLRFQHSTSALEDPSRIAQVKRSIAKIQTVMTERRVAAAKAEAGS